MASSDRLAFIERELTRRQRLSIQELVARVGKTPETSELVNGGERLFITTTFEWANDSKTAIRISACARGHGAWNLDPKEGSITVRVPERNE